MYNLIWRSVTCRPGNGGLLSGVKRPIIARTIATARRGDPIKDHTVASVVPPIGLRPHSGTTLAALSPPDCRSVLTLIVAGHLKGQKPAITLRLYQTAGQERTAPHSRLPTTPVSDHGWRASASLLLGILRRLNHMERLA